MQRYLNVPIPEEVYQAIKLTSQDKGVWLKKIVIDILSQNPDIANKIKERRMYRDNVKSKQS